MKSDLLTQTSTLRNGPPRLVKGIAKPCQQQRDKRMIQLSNFTSNGIITGLLPIFYAENVSPAANLYKY